MQFKLQSAIDSRFKSLYGDALGMDDKEKATKLKEISSDLVKDIFQHRKDNGIVTPPRMQDQAGPQAGPPPSPPSQMNLAPGKGVKMPDGKIYGPSPDGSGWVEVPTS
jgi:hypothetical protein